MNEPQFDSLGPVLKGRGFSRAFFFFGSESE